MTPIPVTYDISLLVLSYFVSAFGSWTALMLARQIVLGDRRDRQFWIWSAAFAMGGGGIWSMHFIAMLAYRMPIPVGYDAVITLLSLVVAVGATAIGFAIARMGSVRRCLMAGVPMGLGIAAMHFTGIAAMRLPATMSFAWSWTAAAVAIGTAASAASLYVAHRTLEPRIRIVGALGLAGGVSAMHHSAMAGMTFTADPESAVLVPLGLEGPALAYGVCLMTVTILVVALGVTRPLWAGDPEYRFADDLE